MKAHILVRYGELSLKKTNRKQFIRHVNEHIKNALKAFPKLQFQSKGLRYYIILNEYSLDENKINEIIGILKKIPGIHSFSIVSYCPKDLEQIKLLAKQIILEEQKKGFKTFKVDTHRADKNFPLTSLEITKEISRYLFKEIDGLKAQMDKPDLVLSLDVREEGVYLFTSTISGLGGFPAGIQGRALLMVSGGIDSVVAGFLAIKKGVEIEAVHFASPPYTSDMSLQKVIDLLEQLCSYTFTGEIKLHIVPFATIQQLIYQNVKEDYGITIMRRLMYRISEKIAQSINALAIINGESIGQVASQTLESIQVINDAINIPVIRPLSALDKQEIVDIAHQIETFAISIRPYEDCCTIFVPRHPQIKPKLNIALLEEAKIDYHPLLEDALGETKVINLSKKQPYSVLGPIEEF